MDVNIQQTIKKIEDTKPEKDLFHLTRGLNTCYLAAATSRQGVEVMSEILANMTAWKIVILAPGIPQSQLRKCTLPGRPSMAQQKQFKQKTFRLSFFLTKEHPMIS